MITSTKNRQVTSASKLKKRGIREQERRFLAEGAQATREAIDAGAVDRIFHVPDGGGRVDAVVSAATDAGIPVVAVSDPVMAHLTATVTPQGVMAVARFVDVPIDELPPDVGVVPVLCSVRDPGNAGTILRSADAAAAGAVVFSADSVDVYNPKTVRASAGSLFHLPVVRGLSPGDAVEAMRGRGARVLAAAADGRASVYEVDLTEPTAVLFGNEAWGLRPEVAALADDTVRVPIQGRAESLNLAAASALVLFEAARQRGGTAGDAFARLVATAAHDLRQPLTAFKGFTATLATRWDQLDDERRRDLVRGLILDSERVSASVTMLVDAARMATGDLTLQRDRHDLADVGRWVAERYAASADAPAVEVRGTAPAPFDRERLRAAVLALCDEAAAWGRGPLSLRAAGTSGTATLDITRQGEGPSDREALALFDERAGRMGPLMARRIVELHGGSLEAGPGLRFRVTLPG